MEIYIIPNIKHIYYQEIFSSFKFLKEFHKKTVDSMNLNKKLVNLCRSLEQEFKDIPALRLEKLSLFQKYLIKKIEGEGDIQLIVICTHNSRRSHIGQLSLALAAEYYQIPNVNTFSGGTEATAFNSRAVKAMEVLGFEISTEDEKTENPLYQVRWNNDMEYYAAFSKKYDHEINPNESFGAIMVCNSADEACPVVLGADFRLSLPYEDPKAFDDSELESVKYLERGKQIARDMLFVMSGVSDPGKEAGDLCLKRIPKGKDAGRR